MNQQGFIGIVLIIVAALAIGGGVYYHQRTLKQQAQVDTSTAIQIQRDIPEQQDQKNTPINKPLAVSFETKARSLAEAGECRKYGMIGAVKYKYGTNGEAGFVFVINEYKSADSASSQGCSVDLKANTSGVIPLMGMGLIPTPKEKYDSIPVADPSKY